MCLDASRVKKNKKKPINFFLRFLKKSVKFGTSFDSSLQKQNFLYSKNQNIFVKFKNGPFLLGPEKAFIS